MKESKSNKFNIIFKIFIIALIVIFARFSIHFGFCADGEEYMIVLKNGSSVLGTLNSETPIDSESVKVIKIITSFGELSVPKEEIVKFFKQSTKSADDKNVTSAAKGSNASENKKIEEKKPEDNKIVSNKVEDNKTEEKKAVDNKNKETESEAKISEPASAVKPEASPAVAGNEKTEVKSAVNKKETGKKIAPETIENEEKILDMSGQTFSETAPKPNAADADKLLNMDDDKLIDLLGESDAQPPAPVLDKDIEKSVEIDGVKKHYRAEKKDRTPLIPKNLNSIEADVKKIASCATEEDWLLSKSTKEVGAVLADTMPVEVIKVGGDTALGTAEAGVLGTLEALLSNASTKEVGAGKKGAGTAEIIIDETIEAQVIGGDSLSEKIAREFKKHKARPSKTLEEKKHLNEEIEKHFSPKDDKPSDTKEIKVEKKGKPAKKK